MKIVNKSCLAQRMTEKIAVEVDAKIGFGKKCKNRQQKNLMHFVTLSKTVGPNLKSYSEIFLSEFYENSKKNLPTLTINLVIDC